MLQRVRIRLTIINSSIFLLLFWSLTAAIYLWMNFYFGDPYMHHEKEPAVERVVYERSQDQIMDELRNAIIILDGVLFFTVPFITWILIGRALQPVSKAHEREKQFLTDASHDLRTPLTILQGEIEVALLKDRNNKEYKATLVSNKEEINTLISIVETMLFFARNPKGNAGMQKEKIDVTDIVAERVAFFVHLARQKKQGLKFHPPKEQILIEGNKGLCKRLFNSLLDNAIKYTSANGKIDVYVEQKKKDVFVSFVDNGIGIPQNLHEKIFDRFYRADSSLEQKGYGIGLSLVKQIMELHKGTIQLISKVGKGTTITLQFPKFKQTQERNRS